MACSNKFATSLQHHCNIIATSLQHHCNIIATSFNFAINEPSSRGRATKQANIAHQSKKCATVKRGTFFGMSYSYPRELTLDRLRICFFAKYFID
jgi:hypothetical protein